MGRHDDSVSAAAAADDAAGDARLRPVDPHHPDPGVIGDAAAALRSGRLVAFPTETVYGLGANAFDPVAVAAVFAVKGRPASDPLILHVASIDDAMSLTARWSDAASALAEAFWPGPLTLVLDRSERVIDGVTGGGPTVAVRLPAHPVAEGLIRAAGVPVAAPSANRFGRVSPTTAAHVASELGPDVSIVIDGGPTQLGVESTVVDVTARRPRVLRPGGVSLEDLRGLLGDVDHVERDVHPVDAVAISPGSSLGHYSPDTPLTLVEGDPSLVGALEGRLAVRGLTCVALPLPADSATAARDLYSLLRALDTTGVDLALARLVDPSGIGRAVNDRLYRAAHGRLVVDAADATVNRLVSLVRP
ncbi:MAG: L-threonylcarbamoyladenylate synthase [Acidimicrobiales bacterium]